MKELPEQDVTSPAPVLSQPESIGADAPLRPLFRALLFFGIGIVLVFLVGSLVAPFGAAQGRSHGWQVQGAPLAALYALTCAALLLETWLFTKALDQRSLRTLGLWFYAGWGRELAGGAGLGARLMLATVAVLVAARGVTYHGWNELSGAGLLSFAGTAGILALAAAFEEIAFRGYAFQRLVDAWGPLGATVVFAALFGAAHIPNPSATPVSTANTVLAGILFSLAYLRTRGLWMPIGLHWAWNFAMGPVLGLPVSGIKFTPMLLRAEPAGTRWLSGGPYGPEGGLAATPLVLLGIFWLARTRRIAPSPAMAEALK